MKYRKLPVVIEAERFSFGMEDGQTKSEDMPKDIDTDKLDWIATSPTIMYPYIQTLEGRHYIGNTEEHGVDWIITGVQGERYPCKPEIFATTYELAE